jgi:hypothetical protein
MFDRNKTVRIDGVVKEYEWTNPHVWLHIMAADGRENRCNGPFEMQSSAGYARRLAWIWSSPATRSS